MIVTRPFILETRKFFPNAHITLSITTDSQLGAPIDLADSVHIVPGKDQRHGPLKERFKQLNALPEQDIIFDLVCTNRSSYITLLTKAKLKVSYPHRDLQARMLYDICLKRSSFSCEAEVMLQMLMFFGHQPSLPLDFQLPDNRQVRDTHTPYVSFFTGSAAPSKCYPLDQYKQVIEQLAKSYPQLDFVLLEGTKPEETQQGWEAVITNNTNVRVQPLLSIDGVTEHLAKASLVISNDTGIRNVAIATHTPTLGIFIGTVPYRYLPTYEAHYIVYNPDKSIASVDKVFNKAIQAITELKLLAESEE
ncbi:MULTISPECIES: glycosyltransferase family 9 protein [unclassified Agarivorans]|uniref:glycosyltransferase family 9 protein n=1 Tax=unclassified Agarivorans TaxID=2636026 RepID=UPI0026E25752|nr:MULTISPECIES: glycosyltransferase family 9 protein [unclassified Agarivorans]MDO6685712.1 glycosyltransferase family 9 protein [Agarivorans sp. 3_MG-2023]MDO6716173.1 glycosyltransferase family 9 protein [Agarivorans sp. 2_MG-2023]